jgi:hypothetical protein
MFINISLLFSMHKDRSLAEETVESGIVSAGGFHVVE